MTETTKCQEDNVSGQTNEILKELTGIILALVMINLSVLRYKYVKLQYLIISLPLL